MAVAFENSTQELVACAVERKNAKRGYIDDIVAPDAHSAFFREIEQFKIVPLIERLRVLNVQIAKIIREHFLYI